jgi:hypothetical protein
VADEVGIDDAGPQDGAERERGAGEGLSIRPGSSHRERLEREGTALADPAGAAGELRGAHEVGRTPLHLEELLAQGEGPIEGALGDERDLHPVANHASQTRLRGRIDAWILRAHRQLAR